MPMAVLADGATRSMTKTRAGRTAHPAPLDELPLGCLEAEIISLSRLQRRGTGIDCDMIVSRTGRSVAVGPFECGVGFSGIRWTT